ncbi:MAG TPA: E3 binding domain-containing protein [Kiritimatiellia bacterium]|jgi:pyruvate/2-oxoglutarate dehydrogenase complex dihydrolipoamide acyltransferase (E2) component|nr:E3 binding domain-containing protein [Kiritimatiellia bacterium]HOM58866.1 E3 binding domain-containing protein [Kiritimatiellia bacterium]HOR97247.1 E3 binding domain-containing protein [Kiritimatiellia bacterium]HPC48513.1 E3 binding domain-containing protein [Kiritimatiellia bacterium]HPK37347.1 E3 binding domain-containing protein [Kiritimatiellia bacterium]
MTQILIPQLDANVVEVTLSRWRKQVGDTVEAGECVAELATDKAAYELEAPASGTLLAVYATAKSVVPTGFIAGLIGAPGEEDPSIPEKNAALTAAYRGTASAGSGTDRGTRIRATPRARRLAREHHIDLEKVRAETGADLIDETVLAPYLPA